ncbi:MAG: hypothetical protein CMD27_00100 [Flavobacteriales bacterium]|nr:hypothetical protein [Flavobacteriales bacterium]
MKLRSYIICFCICFSIGFGYLVDAQIAVTNNPPFDNPENIVNNILLGDGIETSNWVWQNGDANIGYFDGNNANIGFDEGVIMSTGGIDFVTTGIGAGPGITGDVDLEIALSELGMTGFSVNNVTILEFDFVAESESMAFNYVFGSMEYTSFTCSGFNDIFGFFLSGPGITGPYTNNGINLALVPEPEGAVDYAEWLTINTGVYTTTPVAINTVNNGDPNEDFGDCSSLDPNWESYNVFWVDNDYIGAGWQGVNQPSSPEFTVQGLTGFTTPLIAEYNNLICGETYHIKLAIADCADGILNSAVFLEANSFASPEVEISTVPNTELGLVLDVENGVLEGCGEVAIQFDRDGDLSMDLDVTLEYAGDAVYGIDYEELPTEITLPAFEEQIILPIQVFFDNIAEGQELLNITISGVPVACEETTVQTIEIIILDQDLLVVDMPNQININCTGSALIEASVQGGYPPYNYIWYDELGVVIESGDLAEEGVLTIEQFPVESTSYTLSVTDDCLNQLVEESINVIVEDEILNVSLGADTEECQDIEGFIYLGILDGMAYYMSYETATWQDANTICNNLGGNLVAINSEEEQDFVYNIAMTNNPLGGPYNYWIGLNDYNDEGNFTWTNGDPVTYTNWNDGEPNGGFGENGVEVFSMNSNSPGFWNDAPAFIERRIILEIPCDYQAEDIVICEEDLQSIVLEPQVIGGFPPYNYTWFYNGVVISNEEVLNELPGDGLYQLVVEEACGNIDGDQVNVSFIELAPYVEIVSYDVLDPLFLPEGCFESILQFNTQTLEDEDVVLEFEITGSASAEDYLIESNTVIIPAGEETVSVPLSILVDEEEEGVESIVFNFPFIDECSEWPNQITVQIYDAPNLIVDIDEELVLCENDVGALEGFYSGGLGNVNYGWYLDGQLLSSDLELSTEDLDPGLYSFAVVDQCANSASQDINYSIIELTPTVTLSSNDFIDPSELYEGCGSSFLNFEMPYPYSQDTDFYFNILGSPTFVNGMDIVEINNFVSIPAGDTFLELEITPLLDVLNEGVEEIIFEFSFATLCAPQDPIAVSINNYSDLIINMPNSETVCLGQSLDLSADVSGGVPPYEYSWTYMEQSSNANSIFVDVEEGVNQAIFSVTDNCGYTESSSVDLEGLSVDDFEVIWPPNEVSACYGDNSEISLLLEGGLPPFTFQWYLDGVPTNSPAPYLPWSNDNWLPDASQTIATSPPYTPYEYTYLVEITDSCQNEPFPYEILVTVDECILPTAFTPNGDGNNDVFWVDFGDLSTPVSLEIFNRWGEVVFRSADYTPCANFESECWDGTHFQKYGEKCSEGVYYYVFTYSNIINNTDNYNVSNFTESVFGNPHNNSKGRQRTGSVLLFH